MDDGKEGRGNVIGDDAKNEERLIDGMVDERRMRKGAQIDRPRYEEEM